MSRYLGDVSAYAYAVSKGYTGTEEEFAELMASYASVAEDAGASARAAASSASDASASKTAAGQSEANAAQSESAAATSARQAQTAASNAGQSETNAGNSASAAAGSASQAALSATQAANSAQSANLSATDANTAKSGAETAQTKAETAQGKAETAQGKAEEAQSEAEQAAQSISESAEQIETNKENIEDLQTAIERKANIDGYYEDLGSGRADQLNSTQYVEDSTPYLFRTTGGSADVGDRADVRAIVGGSVVWNQVVKLANKSAYGITFTYNESNGTVTINGTATRNITRADYFSPIADMNMNIPANHKVYISGFDGHDKITLQYIGLNYQGSIYTLASETVRNLTYGLFKFSMVIASGTTFDNEVFTMPMIIDLTAMFGPTIADYIYSLEQASAGAGVAWFRKLFPSDYYPFDAGTLKHVEGLSAHDTVGFNLFNKETATDGKFINGTLAEISDSSKGHSDFIPVFPSTKYYCTGYAGTSYYAILWCDANKQAIADYSGASKSAPFSATSPPNARYAILNYNLDLKNSVCFNLSWSGWRDGDYKPYAKHSYPLDPSVVLRGIPKLDSQNNLYYDGDTYESDGTVTRKYGAHTFDGTESLIRVGTNTSGWYQYAYTPSPATTNNTAWDCMTDFPADGMNYSSFDSSNITKNVVIHYGLGIRFVLNVSTVAEAQALLTGHTLVYPLATETTETVDPYQETQIVDDFGTEEYVSTGIVPVGHETHYPANLRDKLQHLPDLADSDGYYMISQSGHQMTLEHFRIPKAPTEDGTYTLKATVSGGTPTYTWEAEA